jgi:hypothetical protein
VRYLDLSESVNLMTRKGATGTSSVSFLGRSFVAPAFELTDDSFHGRSQFFGGQVGLQGEYFFLTRLFVGFAGKLAVGRTDEVSSALGTSTLQARNTPPQTAAGGLYALPSNSGRFVNQDLAWVPQVQLRGGVLIMPWLRATVGYDFLYWSRVLRPGDQIDLVVDPRQVPTDPAYRAGTVTGYPRPMTNHSDFWAQGFNVGLELAF